MIRRITQTEERICFWRQKQGVAIQAQLADAACAAVN